MTNRFPVFVLTLLWGLAFVGIWLAQPDERMPFGVLWTILLSIPTALVLLLLGGQK